MKVLRVVLLLFIVLNLGSCPFIKSKLGRKDETKTEEMKKGEQPKTKEMEVAEKEKAENILFRVSTKLR